MPKSTANRKTPGQAGGLFWSKVKLLRSIRGKVRGGIRDSVSIKRSRHIIGKHHHTMVRRKSTFRAGGNPFATNLFDMLRPDFTGLAGRLTAGTASHVAFSHGGETTTRKRAVIIRGTASKNTVYKIVTV